MFLPKIIPPLFIFLFCFFVEVVNIPWQLASARDRHRKAAVPVCVWGLKELKKRGERRRDTQRGTKKD
jgi:hypothetical protein